MGISSCLFLESCGKCTPCREGTLRMHEILDRIKKGNGKKEDLHMLEKLGKYISQNALCGLGMTAANPALTTLKYFREEYEELLHIHKKHSGNKGQKYNITSKCIGCGLCKSKCPVQAINGQPKKLHSIDQKKCVGCGLCYKNCPTHAIEVIQNEN